MSKATLSNSVAAKATAIQASVVEGVIETAPAGTLVNGDAVRVNTPILADVFKADALTAKADQNSKQSVALAMIATFGPRFSYEVLTADTDQARRIKEAWANLEAEYTAVGADWFASAKRRICQISQEIAAGTRNADTGDKVTQPKITASDPGTASPETDKAVKLTIGKLANRVDRAEKKGEANLFSRHVRDVIRDLQRLALEGDAAISHAVLLRSKAIADSLAERAAAALAAEQTAAGHAAMAAA
jgi:hypothetical protein